MAMSPPTVLTHGRFRMQRRISMKKRTHHFIAALSAASIWLGAEAYAQPYIYPSKGQSQEQQERDKFECYNWARQQTGFDPTAPSTPVLPRLPQGQSAPTRGSRARRRARRGPGRGRRGDCWRRRQRGGHRRGHWRDGGRHAARRSRAKREATTTRRGPPGRRPRHPREEQL